MADDSDGHGRMRLMMDDSKRGWRMSLMGVGDSGKAFD